ncbi:MAG: hypothetical protein GF331_06110 [Chitinivibrionales bacterium]|nr:hypothetical protein [Chitinivibrionales bacterium]
MRAGLSALNDRKTAERTPIAPPPPTSARFLMPCRMDSTRYVYGPGDHGEITMLRSWNLGRIAGISVNVHGTFLILLGFIVLSGLFSGGAGYAALELTTILTLFGVVILHELGHALAARQYGITTRDITLYPIGGIARLERMPERPSQELVVAMAGPAVNFALAAGAYALATLPAAGISAWLLQRFMIINIGLGVFNLLPAFPMDGGRVLRAFLALKYDYLRATRTAARVGRFMAVGLALLALQFNPMLLLIAAFVWIAGSAEERAVAARYSRHTNPFFWFANYPRQQPFTQGPSRHAREPWYEVVDD